RGDIRRSFAWRQQFVSVAGPAVDSRPKVSTCRKIWHHGTSPDCVVKLAGFSRLVRNAHEVSTFVGASREGSPRQYASPSKHAKVTCSSARLPITCSGTSSNVL